MRRSSLAILAAVVLSCPLVTARAQNTVLVMDSDPGEFIGGGLNYYYTLADGVFDIGRGSYDNGVGLTFDGNQISWTLGFGAPGAAPLQVQNYENAVNLSLDKSRPRIGVNGDGRACEGSGHFEVKQIVYGEGDTIISFHATFTQYCGPTQHGPALTGEILFNSSDPLPPKNHITSPLTDFGTRNQFLQYKIRASNSPTSFGATDLPPGLSVDSGTGFISGTPTAQGTFLVPISAVGTGGTASGILSLTIDPPGQSTGPYTALYLRSESGDLIGQGKSYFFAERMAILPATGRPKARR